MPGPPPTPTSVLRARGSWRAKAREHEPQPKSEAPQCPKCLDSEARKEWRRLARQLVFLGLLSKIDRALLAAYCTAWSRWRKAEAEIAKTGEIVKGPTGHPMQSPWLAIAAQAQKQLHAYAAEFGLTPAARARVRAQPKPSAPTSGAAQFFASLQ